MLSVVAHASEPEALKAKLEEARLRYDLTAAETVRDEIRTWNRQSPNEQSNREFGEASLLVAELYRIEFEEAKEAGRPEKRELGKSIDLAAQEGLSALESVTPDSECFRMRADLIGTMIRSDFQAQKHHAKMDEDVAKALEMDPKNARAHVSAAKPFLFAPEHHGKDLDKGIGKLNEALALEPTLEPALLLRAFAYEHLGKHDLAVADWNSALVRNPACKPAKEKLAGQGGRTSGSEKGK
jgi:tetratricopeptide (TPR) repeat protein